MKPEDAQSPDAGPSKERLDSWKEIASYLKREVRTVQRWEKSEGLPVRRHLHKKQGTVYAYKSELDAWWNQRGVRVPGSAEAVPAPVAEPSESMESGAEAAPLIESFPSATKGHWMPSMSAAWRVGSGLVAVAAIAVLLHIAITGNGAPQNTVRLSGGEYPKTAAQRTAPSPATAPSMALARTENPPSQDALTAQTQPQQPPQKQKSHAPEGWFEKLAAEVHRNGRKVIEDTASLWNARVEAGHPLAAMVRWDRLDSRSSTILDSGGLDHGPQFSPDGRQIIFASDRSGSREIWIADANGQNARRLTDMGAHLTGTPRWSPDGRSIVFDSYPDGTGDIFVVSAEGGSVRRITSAPSMEVVPSWSRDGRSIYFASDRSGAWQVFKKNVMGGDEIQVTRNGGFAAFESYDGKWLYYARHDASGLWRVPVNGGEEVQVLDQLAAGLWGYWALSPGGIYFAVGPNSIGSRQGRAHIEFFSFASSKISTVMELEGRPVDWDPGLTVSPNGQSILYAQLRDAAPGTN